MWGLNMWGNLKFAYEALKLCIGWTTACISKSCEVCALLKYCASTFQDNLSVPASRVKKFKRENTHKYDTIFFFMTLSVI